MQNNMNRIPFLIFAFVVAVSSSCYCQLNVPCHFDNIFLQKTRVNKGEIIEGIDLVEFNFRDTKGKRIILHSFLRQTSLSCIQLSEFGCCLCPKRTYSFEITPLCEKAPFYESSDSILISFVKKVVSFPDSLDCNKFGSLHWSEKSKIPSDFWHHLPDWKLILWQGHLFKIGGIYPCCEFVRFPRGYEPKCPCAIRN
jgi:hypothetical protein